MGLARAGTAYTDSFTGTSLTAANWGASSGYPGSSSVVKGFADSFSGTSLSTANWGASGGYPGSTNAVKGFADSFSGTSLNTANWGASGGNPGSNNSVNTVNNGLQLTTGTQGYSESWIEATTTNYSYVNTTETFQASLSGISNSAPSGAGFSIYLVGGDASSANLSSYDPCYYSPSVIQLWIFSNGSGGYTVQLYGKTNTPNADAGFLAQLPGTFAANGTLGFTISNNGSGNASTVTFYDGTVAQTVSLPASYNSYFSGSNGAVKLFLMSQTGTTGASTTVVLSQFTANHGLQLATGTQSYSQSWVEAAAANYSYVNTTETFQASLSGISNSAASASGFSIYLMGGDATTAELTGWAPSYASPSVIQLWVVSNGSGGYIVQLMGKTNSPNTNPALLAQLPGTFTANGTIGFTISNSGSSNASTVTFYDGTVAQTVSLPASYNSYFSGSNGAVRLFLMSQTGTTGIANTVAISQFTVNNGLQLTTGTQSYSERWMEATAANYSYVNSTETFQASLSGISNSTASTSGFSIYLVGGDATSSELTGWTPSNASPSVIQLWVASNGSGGYSVQLFGKTNAPNTNPALLAQLPGTFAANGTIGFTISNSGSSNASTVTFYEGAVAQTISLPASYNSYFSGSNGAVRLFLMSQTGTTGVATTVTLSQFTANGFTDSFAGTSLNSVNWATSGGYPGESASVNNALQLTTGAQGYGTSWMEAAAANYSYINNTEIFEASLSGISNSAASTSGFSIYLVGGDATSAQLTSWTPCYASPSVIQLLFTSNGNGGYAVQLMGKTNSPNANPGFLAQLTGSEANMTNGVTAAFPYGSGTVGFAIINNGVGKNSTITFYFEPPSSSPAPEEPVSQSFSLPASYNSCFSGSNGAVHLFLMSQTGTNGVANTATFSQFTASAQPVITTNLAVNPASTKQTITALGGNYALDSMTWGSYFVLDNCGGANLSSLKPTYARTAIPLDLWEPVQQAINPSNINWSYFSSRDTAGSNLHNTFLLLQNLQNAGVNHIMFTIWNLAPWMYSSSGSNQITDAAPQREAVLAGIATYLIYAHNNYGLNLSNIYLSFDEPDLGTGPLLTAQQYADIITDAKTYLASFSSGGVPYFTSTKIWVAGDTCQAGVATDASGNLIGTATPATCTTGYTYQLMQDLAVESGGSAVNQVAALGYHSWDAFLDPSVLHQISTMGTAYGLPVFVPEVGQSPNVWQSNDAQTIEQGWDWGRTLATTYQRVLNYSGSSVALLWEYMNDLPIRDNTTNAYPYPSYYLINQFVNQNFPAGSVILSATVTGNSPGSPGDMEAIAAESSSSKGYATMVQIIQNDFRGVGVAIAGLKPSTTYTVTLWNAANAAYSTNGTGAATSLASVTTSSAGTAILNIPPAPIENDIGSTATYVGSGSLVTLSTP